MDLPLEARSISCKWVFKIKLRPNGSVEKFKARLVVMEFTQMEGIDFSNIYSSVTRITSFRVLIALASIHKLIIH